MAAVHEGPLPLTINFSGGAELLFGNVKEHKITLKPGDMKSAMEAASTSAPAKSIIVNKPKSDDRITEDSTVDSSGTKPDDKAEQDVPPCFNLRHLLLWMRDHMVQERPELFVTSGSSGQEGDVSNSAGGINVRPGILVLVNDVDWELLGLGDYELQPKDQVHFISTLHGG